MDITLATGVTIDYDETDLKEHKKLSNYAFYSPSVEYYLKNEKDNLNKVIIVGAGVGIYSKYLDSESIETINIEPVLSRFNKLEANLDNATNYNKACSDASGTGTMYYFDNAKSGAKLDIDFGDNSESVDIITVDSLNITDADLLVIDANGKEYEVLQGSATSITPSNKVIVKWNTDICESKDELVLYLQNSSKTCSILHWESSDNSIEKKQLGTAQYPWDLLSVVIDADILME